MKLRRAATSPRKPATSPALGRSASIQTPKRVVPKAGSSPLKSGVSPVHAHTLAAYLFPGACWLNTCRLLSFVL